VEEGLVLFSELGIQSGFAITYLLEILAYAMFFQGDLAAAHTLAQECLMLEREAGRKDSEAYMLALLGEVTLQQGDPLTARMLLEESCALLPQVRLVRELIDEEHKLDWTRSLLGKVLAVQGNHPAARALYEESLKNLIRVRGVNSDLPFVDLACVLEGLAAVVAAQGELAWAARLWGAAQARRETQGPPLPPVYRADYERAVKAACAQFGEKPFALAWAQGRTMPLEQVLAAQGPVSMAAAIPADLVTAPPVPKASPYGLTAREVEVLRLVAQGLTDPQVAEQLVISPHTVNSHLKAIYGKLGVSSRSAATRYAIEHHLL
jgi:ATP/maltotriose-dependent transcriptional regulator MalT